MNKVTLDVCTVLEIVPTLIVETYFWFNVCMRTWQLETNLEVKSIVFIIVLWPATAFKWAFKWAIKQMKLYFRSS
jgi:hypothetical protein